MENMSILPWILALGAVVAVLAALFFRRCYKRASPSRAYVRTGLGGGKAVVDGGALCIPVLHETVDVGLTPVVLPLDWSGGRALATRDGRRAEVRGEASVHVPPKREAVFAAARTLGPATLDAEALARALDAKLDEALSRATAEMSLDEMLESHPRLVRAVEEALRDALRDNGLAVDWVRLHEPQ